MECDGVVVRILDSQSRDSEFKSSWCCFEASAIFFAPHCHSSLSCINEYVTRDGSGYVNR